MSVSHSTYPFADGNPAERLASNLRILRRNSGMSQEEAAEALSVSRIMYARYETGQSIPSAEKIRTMASLFGVSVTTLILRDLQGSHVLQGTIPSPAGELSLEELLESASDLVSLKYYYTDADTYTNSKTAFGKKIPFTTDQVVFKYSGVVNAGIDMSLVRYEINDEEQKITLYLPEPKIISHEIDEDSFEFFDVKNSVFTETKLEDYVEIVSDLKAEKEEYLAENGEFFHEVIKNAEDVLTNFVTAPEQTKSYNVVFEEGQSAEAETSSDTNATDENE